MTSECPVRRCTIVARGWVKIGLVREVGHACARLGDDWLCPVEYYGGGHGVVRVTLRLDGNGRDYRYRYNELKTGDQEIDQAIKESTSMPEVIVWDESHCRIGYAQGCTEMCVDVTLMPDGSVCGAAASLLDA